eukprot:9653544-Karenia_brevis.AAC.1
MSEEGGPETNSLSGCLHSDMAAVPEDPEDVLVELWKADIRMAAADVDSSKMSDIGSATSQRSNNANAHAEEQADSHELEID